MAALLAAAIVATGAGCSSGDDSSGRAHNAGDTSGAASSEGGAAGVSARAARGDRVAVPTVSGPITGGTYGMPFNPLPARLADKYHYDEDEYFVTGRARAYRPKGPWAGNGRWAVRPAGTAPYTTRILVRRPADAGDFNGTVVVEWLNVTAGMDADAEFGLAHDELLRDGYVWVGVSAQVGGVEGGGGLQLPIDIPGLEIKPLKQWDPERYGRLHHPGDDYSYDIFSQAAQVVRRPKGVDPLRGLAVRQVLAVGESQSAMRLVTYVDAVHPRADIYDGFLIHSRGGSGAPINSETPDAVPEVAHIRTDLGDPVLQFQTETDLFGVLGFYPARQPDTARLRTWEVAGTAHADQTTLDYGIESGREWNTTATVDFSSQCGRINNGPQTFVLRKAVAALAGWVAGGDPPAKASPIEVAGAKVVRDDHGNALGGIRTPAVDAPIATLTGESPPGKSPLCLLFGGVTAFDASTLEALYPSHDDYVDAVREAARSAVAAGFLLPPDRDQIVRDARDAAVPS